MRNTRPAGNIRLTLARAAVRIWGERLVTLNLLSSTALSFQPPETHAECDGGETDDWEVGRRQQARAALCGRVCST